MATATHLKDDFKNPWFLGMLALIGTALAGTIWMAMIAGATSPGLVSENYYEKGKNYFHQAPGEVQGGPQWRLKLLAPEVTRVGQPQTYRLYAINEQGKPVREGTATLYAYRPSDAKADFTIPMQLDDAGTFSAAATFPLPGTWDLIAQVDSEGKQVDIAQRLFIQE